LYIPLAPASNAHSQAARPDKTPAVHPGLVRVGCPRAARVHFAFAPLAAAVLGKPH